MCNRQLVVCFGGASRRRDRNHSVLTTLPYHLTLRRSRETSLLPRIAKTGRNNRYRSRFRILPTLSSLLIYDALAYYSLAPLMQVKEDGLTPFFKRPIRGCWAGGFRLSERTMHYEFVAETGVCVAWLRRRRCSRATSAERERIVRGRLCMFHQDQLIL